MRNFGFCSTRNAFYRFLGGFRNSVLFVFKREKEIILLHLLSGFSFGMAFMMKQHALLGFLWGCIVCNQPFDISQNNSKSLRLEGFIVLSFGSILPYGILLIIMYSGGLFDQFWFWTVEYARSYTTTVTTIEDAKMLCLIFLLKACFLHFL